MRKRIYTMLLLVIIGFLLMHRPVIASANERLTNDEAFEFLKEAFEAQISIGERFRAYGEIRDILKPYFSDEYAKLFLEENLFLEEEGYITYGTDFALYYIPFFSYTNDTNVIFDEEQNRYVIYEFFPKSNEGPVTYNDHYEVIILVKDGSQWKVNKNEISEEKPEFIKELENNEANVNSISLEIKNETYSHPATSVFLGYLAPNPIFSLYSFLEMEYKNQAFYMKKGTFK